MINPDKVSPPLPPARNVTPLVRIPEPMSLTEKIGGTEYTVNAHFQKDGREGESNSIVNQDAIYQGYFRRSNHDFLNTLNTMLQHILNSILGQQTAEHGNTMPRCFSISSSHSQNYG